MARSQVHKTSAGTRPQRTQIGGGCMTTNSSLGTGALRKAVLTSCLLTFQPRSWLSFNAVKKLAVSACAVHTWAVASSYSMFPMMQARHFLLPSAFSVQTHSIGRGFLYARRSSGVLSCIQPLSLKACSSASAAAIQASRSVPDDWWTSLAGAVRP